MLSESEATSNDKYQELFSLEVNSMTKLHLIYIMYERVRAKLNSKVFKDPNTLKIFMTVLANFALK